MNDQNYFNKKNNYNFTKKKKSHNVTLKTYDYKSKPYKPNIVNINNDVQYNNNESINKGYEKKFENKIE